MSAYRASVINDADTFRRIAAARKLLPISDGNYMLDDLIFALRIDHAFGNDETRWEAATYLEHFDAPPLDEMVYEMTAKWSSGFYGTKCGKATKQGADG
jgi:hypothetical protein